MMQDCNFFFFGWFGVVVCSLNFSNYSVVLSNAYFLISLNLIDPQNGRLHHRKALVVVVL